MQIQTLPAGNSTPVAPLADSLARQNAMTQMPGNAESQVGGLQKNAVTGAGSAAQQSALSQQDLTQTVEQINEALQMFSSNSLEFSVDDDTESVVVKVVDKETQEVIRQIPSEEVLNIAKALDKLQGLLIKDQA